MKIPPGPHAILAHYFHGPGHPPAQGALSAAEWEAGLDAYGPRLVPAAEWVERLRAGRQADEVCVTFDDGLAEARNLGLAALERRGLTAGWNVYTGPFVGVANGLERARWLRNHAFGGVEAFYVLARRLVGYPDAPPDYLLDRPYLTPEDRAFRYWRNFVAPAVYETTMDHLETLAPARGLDLAWPWLRPSDLRALAAAGHLIGIHSHSHPTEWTGLSAEQQALEYATSRRILAQVLAIEEAAILTGAHPCGSYTEAGLAWLRAHGPPVMWAATPDGGPAGPSLLTAPRWSTGSWAVT